MYVPTQQSLTFTTTAHFLITQIKNKFKKKINKKKDK